MMRKEKIIRWIYVNETFLTGEQRRLFIDVISKYTYARNFTNHKNRAGDFCPDIGAP